MSTMALTRRSDAVEKRLADLEKIAKKTVKKIIKKKGKDNV